MISVTVLQKMDSVIVPRPKAPVSSGIDMCMTLD